MRPRRFEVDDLDRINAWLDEHGKPGTLTETEIPSVGLIVEDTAAGFLYITDSSVAFLENFVSNPKAQKRQVREAIDEIIKRLMIFAHEAGISRLVGITTKQSMAKRAEAAGFRTVAGAYSLLTARVN